MTIAVVALFMGSGTYAYFSDTDTSSDNAFEAGILNLAVEGNDVCSESITISNLKPGDSAIIATWNINNTGTITGNLSIKLSPVVNNENNCYEMENDSTSGADEGELGQNLKVIFAMDADSSGTWTSGDCYLSPTLGIQEWGESRVYSAYLNDYSSKEWTNVKTSMAGGSSAGKFSVSYTLPVDTGNEVQSDSCTFDIIFTLDQDLSS